MRWALQRLGWLGLLLPALAWGQQVTVETPLNAVGDRFFESMGSSWGVRQGGFSFQFGGGAIPPFGGYSPGAGVHFGGARGGGGLSGSFNGWMAQGASRNLVSQAPSLTLMPGYPGWTLDASYSPFVMGVIPVVGGAPVIGIPAYGTFAPPGFNTAMAMPEIVSGAGSGNPRLDAIRRAAETGSLAEAIDPATRPRAAPPPASDPEEDRPREADFSLPAVARSGDSSAARGAPSVAEARRLRAEETAAQESESRSWYERGRTAEEGGKANVARIYYQMAARRAAGPLREEILARLRNLSQH